MLYKRHFLNATGSMQISFFELSLFLFILNSWEKSTQKFKLEQLAKIQRRRDH